MFKGFIRCSENFAQKASFKYEYKKKLKNGMTNYFNCEVTYMQLEGMEKYLKYFKLDKKLAEWDLLNTTGLIKVRAIQ